MKKMIEDKTLIKNQNLLMVALSKKNSAPARLQFRRSLAAVAIHLKIE